MTSLFTLPTGVPMGAEIIIIAIGVAYTLVSVFLQRKLSNPRKVREIQTRIKRLSEDMNAMVKAKAPNEQISARQKELMPLVGESMKAQMKPLLVITPFFLIIYYLLLPALPMSTWNVQTASVQEIFFITVFALGILSSVFVMVYDKKKAKEEAAAQDNSGSNPQQ